MIHVVSGYRRSGTSMMMQCLHHGLKKGQVCYTPDLEKANKHKDGYISNPGRLLEIGRNFYMNSLFLRQIPDWSVIKILFDGLPNLPKGDWKVIFMDRDPEEIVRSVARSDQHLRSIGVPENTNDKTTFNCFRPYQREDIDHVLGICEMRKDIDLRIVKYIDMIYNPVETLRSLDMPIDEEKAASKVKPKYYRFRNPEKASNVPNQSGRKRSCA